MLDEPSLDDGNGIGHRARPLVQATRLALPSTQPSSSATRLANGVARLSARVADVDDVRAYAPNVFSRGLVQQLELEILEAHAPRRFSASAKLRDPNACGEFVSENLPGRPPTSPTGPHVVVGPTSSWKMPRAAPSPLPAQPDRTFAERGFHCARKSVPRPPPRPAAGRDRPLRERKAWPQPYAIQSSLAMQRMKAFSSSAHG